jgi:hypothetical protein
VLYPLCMINNRLTGVITLCWLLSIPLFSQDSLGIRHKPKHAVKISPLHWLGFYSTVQVAYEVGLTPRIGMQLDAGMVVDRKFLINRGLGASNYYQNKRGVKLKLEARYYFSGTFRGADGFYTSLEPYWNAVNFDRSGTNAECFDAQCQTSFIRYYDYVVQYRELGVGMKGGYMKYFNRDYFIDISIGWMVRSIDYTELTDTPINREESFVSILPKEQDRTVLAPLMGIRLGYRFR